MSGAGPIGPTASLDALVRITRAIGSGQSLEAVFDMAAGEIALLFPYDRCSVALLDPTGEKVIVSSHRGRLRAPFYDGEWPVAGTVADWTIQHRQPLIYAVGPDNRFVEDDKRRGVGIRQMAAVPLIVDGAPVGAFAISSTQSDVYREDDLWFLQSVADHLALAIAATNLRRDAERRAKRAQFLAGTAAAFAASLDLDTTLREAVLRAADVLGDLNSIFLWDDEGRELRLRELSHPDPECEALAREQAAAGPPTPTGPTLGPALHGEPQLVVNVAAKHVSPQLRPFIERLRVRSMVAVPLAASGRIGGLLVSCWTDWSTKTTPSRRAPGVEDLELARELAVQMAVAIENARLFAAARQAIDQRDEFLTVAAHELRTPLTTLKGRAQLLQRRLNDRFGDGDGESLKVILRQLDRMGRMVNDLLDISRIEAGRLLLVRERCDLVALAERSAAEHRTADYPIDVIAQDRDLMGRWDSWRLEQVLANLLSNAVRYSRPGQPITVHLRQDHDEAVLSVADRGIGIEPADLERIFERYYRSGQTVRSGFGLGLAICRQIVDDHSGRLWAESAGRDRGATFTMALPLDT